MNKIISFITLVILWGIYWSRNDLYYLIYFDILFVLMQFGRTYSKSLLIYVWSLINVFINGVVLYMFILLAMKINEVNSIGVSGLFWVFMLCMAITIIFSIKELYNYHFKKEEFDYDDENETSSI